MEKNQTSATSATLHQFELTIFGGISNAQFKKSYKCDFASIKADNLRRHLKTHSLTNQIGATTATLHQFKLTI